MNFSEYDVNFSKQETIKIDKQLWLLLKSFWRFSLYYGEYIASLHSRKDKVER